MENIQFDYFFRDAGNYKRFGSVVFSNPDQIPLKYIEQIIGIHLIDGVFFYPEKWDLPSLVFEGCEGMWCEFEGIELTREIATEGRTILQLLNHIRVNRNI